MQEDNKLNRIRAEGQKMGQEAKDKLLTYIVSAFAFVAGFAWNDAIKSLIDYFFPLGGGTVWAKLIYALAVTVIVVLATILLTRFFNKKDQQ